MNCLKIQKSHKEKIKLSNLKVLKNDTIKTHVPIPFEIVELLINSNDTKQINEEIKYLQISEDKFKKNYEKLIISNELDFSYSNLAELVSYLLFIFSDNKIKETRFTAQYKENIINPNEKSLKIKFNYIPSKLNNKKQFLILQQDITNLNKNEKELIKTLENCKLQADDFFLELCREKLYIMSYKKFDITAIPDVCKKHKYIKIPTVNPVEKFSKPKSSLLMNYSLKEVRTLLKKLISAKEIAEISIIHIPFLIEILLRKKQIKPYMKDKNYITKSIKFRVFKRDIFSYKIVLED